MANNDIAVAKLDPNGRVLWITHQNSLNTTGQDQYPSIVIDTQGNTYVAYYIEANPLDLIVLKLNASGVVQWRIQHPTYSTLTYIENPSIAVDTSANIYLTYCTNNTASGQTNAGSLDIIVIKINTSGSILWIRQQPSFNTSYTDIYPSITANNLGYIFVTYMTFGTASGQTRTDTRDLVVFKLDAALGHTQWVRQTSFDNSISNDSTVVLKIDTNGNVIWNQQKLAYTQPDIGAIDTVVYKLDPSGNTSWFSQQHAFNDVDAAPSLAVTSDNSGNLYASYGDESNVDVFKFKGQPPCFNQGTKILILDTKLQETYVPIEEICVGMMVKTYRQGYRRVELIGKKTLANDPTQWNYCMYRLPKTKDMLDDLIVTGGHSILIDHPISDPDEIARQEDYWGDNQYVICDKYMVMAAVSKRFEQIMDHNIYTYYHLVLEDEGDEKKHYGIWANGILSESQSREHFKMYPFDSKQAN